MPQLNIMSFLKRKEVDNSEKKVTLDKKQKTEKAVSDSIKSDEQLAQIAKLESTIRNLRSKVTVLEKQNQECGTCIARLEDSKRDLESLQSKTPELVLAQKNAVAEKNSYSNCSETGIALKEAREKEDMCMCAMAKATNELSRHQARIRVTQRVVSEQTIEAKKFSAGIEKNSKQIAKANCAIDEKLAEIAKLKGCK